MVKHRRPVVGSLENRLEFETLISDLSSRFVNLPPGEVDREITDSLRQVCECLDLELASLWQRSNEDPLEYTLTHVHRPPGGPSTPERMDARGYSPWARARIAGGAIVSFVSVDELPPEAARDRETFERFGVKSSLILPLAAGGQPIFGALGLNSMRAERPWPDALVQRLQLVAQVFANALARKRADEALRESEERLALAADAAGAGLWTLDYSTGIFWATERARAIFGYSPDEAITMERLEASIHPDDWDLVRGAVERSARAGESVNVEYRIILPDDGRVLWISSRGRPRFTSAGQPERLMGVSIDVTERKRREEAHRTIEDRLAAGAELAGLGFYELDYGAGVVRVDDRLRDLCGLPPKRNEGLQFQEFWLEQLHPDDRLRLLRLRKEQHDGGLDRLSLEYRFIHPSRGEVWIHHLSNVAERDASGRAVRIFGVLRDITPSKRAEEELHQLSRRLIRAQEEERALLARELHDDVTQRLALLAIEAGRAELAAPDGSPSQAMRSVREGLVRLSEDIHSLAYQLHPSVLDELGLAEALRAECERRVRQGRIDFSLEMDPLPAHVGRDAALCLFRVAQEALNNVTRHAGARAASIVLRQMDGGLLLAVRDDGAGFDPASPGTRRSLGLASMRERVRLVNGTLDIESAPGRGTEIIAWVPTEGETR